MQWSSVAKDSAAASLGHFLPLSLLFSPLTSTMRWKSTCKWGVNISCPSTVTLSLIFSITELCFSNIAGLGAPAPVEGDCDLCVSIYSLIHSLNSQVNSQVLHCTRQLAAQAGLPWPCPGSQRTDLVQAQGVFIRPQRLYS